MRRRVSDDHGATWGPIEPLIETPGTVVRQPFVIAPDGAVLAPLFLCRTAPGLAWVGDDDVAALAISRDGGATWSAPIDTALPNNNSSVQAIRLADGRVAMVHNWSSRRDARERRLSLYDEIEDPEAGAAKPAGETRAFWGAPRAPITLSISNDGGRSWTSRHDLELGDGFCLSNNSRESRNRELSYPSIRQTCDGRVHVAYTWRRKAIRHLAFDIPAGP